MEQATPTTGNRLLRTQMEKLQRCRCLRFRIKDLSRSFLLFRLGQFLLKMGVSAQKGQQPGSWIEGSSILESGVSFYLTGLLTLITEDLECIRILNITLTREELSNIVGTATESIIRLLSEFKSRGLIEVNGRKIKILDKPGLKFIANI